MPLYRCPKCGREVEKPPGTYYCKECGSSVIMQKVGDPEERRVVEAREVHIRFCEPGITVINGETGDEFKVKRNQIVHIEGSDIWCINMYYDKLATVFGSPAKVVIEPYYG